MTSNIAGHKMQIIEATTQVKTDVCIEHEHIIRSREMYTIGKNTPTSKLRKRRRRVNSQPRDFREKLTERAPVDAIGSRLEW
jgi:hypothetical protein